MSNIDKQALREEFQYMQDHYSDPADRDRQIIYIAAEALLDENIQLQREKDATEAVLSAMRDDMRQAREQLKAAEHTAAVDHEAACSLVEENEELKRRIAELERSETQLINERDSAESALNDAYKAVMGQTPEWSNWFSFENAIDEIELACELWRNQSDDVIQFRQRITDLETQKADLMEHVLNAYEASALTMTLRKMNVYLPDYLRFCAIYGVDHDAIIDKLDYQSFVLARVNNEDLRQDEAACSLVAEKEELKRRIAELEIESSVKDAAIIELKQQYSRLQEARYDTKAVRDVIAERQRQQSVEGWKPEHDDQYNKSQLLWASSCYVLNTIQPFNRIPMDWPWSPEWWKPSSPRRDLEKAGALILAEIERIDRQEAAHDN